MQEGDVAVILRDMFMVVLKMAAPGLLTALAVGVLISLIQAVTQLNESTLAFVPKLLALGMTLTLAGSFMFATLTDYTHLLFDQLIASGGR